MNEELKTALAEMQSGLEGKSKEQIDNEIKAFEKKYNAVVEEKAKEIVGDELKSFKETLEAEYKAAVKEVQDHANKLDAKMNEKNKKNQGAVDGIRTLIKDNFDDLSKMDRKGHAVSLETKAVGNMTLGTNLTGDQPRDYSNQVAMVPSQLLNVADLIMPITISGGTYTFPRETGSEGGIGTQTEGSDKSQIDYDLTMVDANTDFIAGFAVYSKKMANNLPFLESFLPEALRRDYWKAENAIFNTALAAGVTASTEVITGQNKVEMLIAEVAKLEGANFASSGIVVSPADFYDILVTEKSTGAGYGLPGVVTLINGQLAINGIPVYKATWLAANKYYVGDWSRVKKVITEGLSIDFSNEDSDNFRKNNVTARVECQCTIAIERPDALIYGDFTAV